MDKIVNLLVENYLSINNKGGVYMVVDTNTMLSITEANQNFSKVARLENELSSVVTEVEESTVAKDEDVLEISKRLLAQNKEAYEVLAK